MNRFSIWADSDESNKKFDIELSSTGMMRKCEHHGFEQNGNVII